MHPRAQIHCFKMRSLGTRALAIILRVRHGADEEDSDDMRMLLAEWDEKSRIAHRIGIGEMSLPRRRHPGLIVCKREVILC